MPQTFIAFDGKIKVVAFHCLSVSFKIYPKRIPKCIFWKYFVTWRINLRQKILIKSYSNSQGRLKCTRPVFFKSATDKVASTVKLYVECAPTKTLSTLRPPCQLSQVSLL
jgi:hypothetical protein